MAKQTFTTGQVLTAAQMTSLQQTAMGGGSTTAKTASYVLVAADAGTVVQMNSASATTITVNTALFAAGDVVFLQNIGAGICTVTAGTATVSTAGSLALTQFEGGQLYFTAAGASVFFDYIQAGTTLPLTTKGDVFGFDTANARIPIGANNTVLTADSAQALGLKWATAAAPAGYSLLSTTSMSGSASISFTNLNLNSYFIWIQDSQGTTSGQDLRVKVNNSTTIGDYDQINTFTSTAIPLAIFASQRGAIAGFDIGNIEATSCVSFFEIKNCQSSAQKQVASLSGTTSGTVRTQTVNGFYNPTTVVTSLQVFINATGTFNAGTIFLYGV